MVIPIVILMSGDHHPASLNPDDLLKECEIRRARRSGPGGQHRNKVETAVVLRHRPTGVVAEAAERRSQAENRRVAIRRLRIKLALETRRPVPAQQEPSPLWRSRCRRGRVAVNPEHDDFPTLLAEVLDVIAAHEADLKAAADALHCTPSQLVKFLKREPAALATVNQWRIRRDLPQLK